MDMLTRKQLALKVESRRFIIRKWSQADQDLKNRNFDGLYIIKFLWLAIILRTKDIKVLD